MAETLQEEIPPPEQTQEETRAVEPRTLATVPWLAMALAGHALLVVAAWFMLPTRAAAQPITVLTSSVESTTLPPEPPREPEQDVEMPTLTPTENDANAPKITPVATELDNSDPADKPTPSLAPNPNQPPDDSVESPDPNPSTSSAVGLTGSRGGGNAGGGDGGPKFSRSKGHADSRERPYIDAALKWLADHQNIEGYWSGTHFADDSRRKNAKRTGNLRWSGETEAAADTGWSGVEAGLTGLSLLAFISTGCDNHSGKYKEQIRRGLIYLKRVQGNDGCDGAKEDHNYVYQHAIATMAVCEAYQSSGDRLLKGQAQRAVDYIVRIQNPGMGWRYGEANGENDSSVTGWMVLALKAARTAGLEFDSHKCYDGASNWLDTVTADYKGYPRTGYQMPASPNGRLRGHEGFDTNASLDAINIMTRLFMDRGWDTKNRTLQSQASICAQDPPMWKKEKMDYYYWYYGSLALFQVGGNNWDVWSKAMTKTLLGNQRGYRTEDAGTSDETLDEFGSWDAVDAWSTAGGRVYSTAINCLTLQVWYRYQRMSEKK